MALRKLATVGAATAACIGCGPEIDSIGQLDGLRIMGVQRSAPYAKPGESVELKMLYHDAGQDEPRDIELMWFSGCQNPPADLFDLCFRPSEAPGSSAQAAPAPGDADMPGITFRDLVENKVPRVDLDAAAGVALGFTDAFSIDIPKDIIERRPDPADPKLTKYGLNYVFFAACAGRLELAAGGPFPVTCLDKDGAPVTSKDFVVGYTAVYAYDELTNRNPKILGFEITDGDEKNREIPDEVVCLGQECEVIEPDEDRKCSDGVPTIEACEDEDSMSEECPEIELRAILDEKRVDEDGVLSAIQGSPVEEQMWVSYHTDRGKFKFDVALVNDADSGFNEETETKFIAQESKGPAFIWAVARDNRGGTDWARFEICVK